jgi:hypothetical protein
MSNCENCGGPLPEQLINGRFVCDFCSTVTQHHPNDSRAFFGDRCGGHSLGGTRGAAFGMA